MLMGTGWMYGMQPTKYKIQPDSFIDEKEIGHILNTQQGKAFVKELEKLGRFVISGKNRGPCNLCLRQRKDWVISRTSVAKFDLPLKENFYGNIDKNKAKKINSDSYTLFDFFNDAFVLNISESGVTFQRRERGKWVSLFLEKYIDILDAFVKCDWGVTTTENGPGWGAKKFFLYEQNNIS